MTTNTDQPTSTPPAGGRWTWDASAAEWLRLPEADTPNTDAPAPAQE